MNRIQWLMQEFGFSTTILATFFRISPSLVHKASQNLRTIKGVNQLLLNDPLFEPYDIRSQLQVLPPPVWEDPEKEIRIKDMEIRAKKLRSEIYRLQTTLNNRIEQHRKHHALLHHTRHLPLYTKGGETLVEHWWIVMKATAWLAVTSPLFHLSNRRSLEMRIVVFQAELNQLEKWLAEEIAGPPES